MKDDLSWGTVAYVYVTKILCVLIAGGFAIGSFHSALGSQGDLLPWAFFLAFLALFAVELFAPSRALYDIAPVSKTVNVAGLLHRGTWLAISGFAIIRASSDDAASGAAGSGAILLFGVFAFGTAFVVNTPLFLRHVLIPFRDAQAAHSENARGTPS